jgi:hypothetical protein
MLKKLCETVYPDFSGKFRKAEEVGNLHALPLKMTSQRDVIFFEQKHQ